MDSNLSEQSKTGKRSKTDDKFKLFCWILKESDSPFPVDIAKNETVGDLKDMIKKKKGHALADIDADSLDIWKLSPPIHSSELGVKLQHAQSPQDIAGCVILDPLHPLSKHFSSPPLEHVHIVVQLRLPCQFGRPRTPSRTRGNTIEFQRSPYVKDEEIRESVDTCLRYARPRVRAFLRENDLCQSWAPPCDDPRVLDHLTKLRIPSIGGRPRLSLHDMGGTVVETAVVDGVFKNYNVHLINTSGSGKTRILFEGLLKHWGLYFTCGREQVLGSEDMSAVLAKPNASNFTNPLPSDADLRQALEHNRSIAWRRFRQVLIARLHILQLFLEEAREICPEGPLDRYRGHWLMLQLRPGDTSGYGDMFLQLTETLSEASDKYLGVKSTGGEAIRLMAHINHDYISAPLYFVLDEAQIPARLYREAYRSDAKPSTERPILREILSAWKITPYIIVSGTGLSEKEVQDVVGSQVAKTDIHEWLTCTNTGAFDSLEVQSAYISRYLPHHLVQSDSGQLLLRRCWSWLRGRHRFTATYLDILISNSFHSPHKILDEYVLHFTKKEAPDSPDFAGSEPKLSSELIANIRKIPFVDWKKITEDSNIASRFGNIICSWILRREYIVFGDDEKRWVELGFARFCHPKDSMGALVDEPLIVLAAAHHLTQNTKNGLFDHVLHGLEHSAGRGAGFEEFIAAYLAQAFGQNVRLCDVFDFGQNIPSWAQSEGVEFVTLSPNGDHCTHHNPLGPSSALSSDLKDATETVQWFRNPHTVMCFPDIHFGPDIVFFIRLSNGMVLCVIVQVRFRSLPRLSKQSNDKAVSTLEFSKFYKNKKLTTKKWTVYRNDIIEIVRNLNRIDDKIWFQDGHPFLRVLATYPAKGRLENQDSVVSLKMERCEEKMDKGNLLTNLTHCLMTKRRNDGMEEGHSDEVKRKKKRRKD